MHILNSEPPSLVLEARDRIVVRVGEPYRINAKITGRPKPKITWERNGSVVPSDEGRFQVNHCSISQIRKLEMDH